MWGGGGGSIPSTAQMFFLRAAVPWSFVQPPEMGTAESQSHLSIEGFPLHQACPQKYRHHTAEAHYYVPLSTGRPRAASIPFPLPDIGTVSATSPQGKDKRMLLDSLKQLTGAGRLSEASPLPRKQVPSLSQRQGANLAGLCIGKQDANPPRQYILWCKMQVILIRKQTLTGTPLSRLLFGKDKIDKQVNFKEILLSWKSH